LRDTALASFPWAPL